MTAGVQASACLPRKTLLRLSGTRRQRWQLRQSATTKFGSLTKRRRSQRDTFMPFSTNPSKSCQFPKNGSLTRQRAVKSTTFVGSVGTIFLSAKNPFHCLPTARAARTSHPLNSIRSYQLPWSRNVSPVPQCCCVNQPPLPAMTLPTVFPPAQLTSTPEFAWEQELAFQVVKKCVLELPRPDVCAVNCQDFQAANAQLSYKTHSGIEGSGQLWGS